MKFIRQDGMVYNPQHKDTVKRLIKSDQFKILDEVNVSELKDYAKMRDLAGYSQLNRDELIKLLEEGI